MVVNEGRDPGREAELSGVFVELPPEDFLGGFGLERGKVIAAAGGEKIDLVVGEPVFEAVLVAVRGIATARELLDVLAHGVGLYHPGLGKQSPDR